MAARRSTKGSQRRHERSGPGRKSGDSSRTPLGAGLEKQQPNLFSGTNERQGLSRFSDVTLIAFLVVGATLPYLNALRNGFVADDETQVLQNP